MSNSGVPKQTALTPTNSLQLTQRWLTIVAEALCRTGRVWRPDRSYRATFASEGSSMAPKHADMQHPQHNSLSVFSS